MHHSHLVDLIIIVAYMVGVVLFAKRFAKRQTSTEQYFTVKRSIPGWAMGVSMFATLITSISFIAYPGKAYAGNWAELTAGFMALIALIVAGTVVIPFYRHAVGMSAYEYFEKRFGYSVRAYSSIIFALGHFLKMGFIFYMLAIAINSLTGWNIYTVIAVAGVVTVSYTLMGGIEAVIWTEVIQGCVLIVGICVIIARLLFLPDCGPGVMLQEAWNSGKMNLGSMNLDFTKSGVLVMACYGFFFYLQKYTADQTVVQRFLVAKTDKSAIRGVRLGASLCIPVWALFLFIGTLTWVYFNKASGEAVPAGLKADQFFPYFLANHMPPGLLGVILASLLASAMGGVSSDLNCLATIGVEDFYRKLFPLAPDSVRLRIGKFIVAFAGALCVLVAITIALNATAALPLYFTGTSIIAGGLFGVFFLAFMSTRAHTRGVWVGIVACLIFSIYATLTQVSGGKLGIIDLGKWNFAWQSVMIGTVGHIVVIVFGYIGSLVLKPAKATDRAMTYWGWRERKHGEAGAEVAAK